MSDKQIVKGNHQEQELGNITVSKEVVAVIAALETIKIKGVAGITSATTQRSATKLHRVFLLRPESLTGISFYLLRIGPSH